MRVLFGMFIIIHGIGHVSWFLASFFPGINADQVGGSPLNSAGLSPTGMVGKLIGVGALVVVLAFVVSAIGVFNEGEWWRSALLAAAAGSALIALLWWNPVGSVSVPALLADVALVVVALLPLGQRIVDAAQ